MIFFRVQTVQLNLQRGEESFLLFVKIKASYSAEVNELSGMTVNLKDVDLWMREAFKIAPSFRHLNEALKTYHSILSQSSKAFQKIEISQGSQICEFDGKQFLYTYKLRSWFKQGQTWVQRPVSLKSESHLGKRWRRQLARKKWSTADRFATLLKTYLPELRILEIRNPQLQIIEKFQF